MSGIEAVYIYNEHNNLVLTHTFTSRPPPAAAVLPLYLAHSSPRPALLYLPSLNPPTLLFSIIQDRLLFISPCSTDVEPLLVIEFLHRVADALEEFLGAPLLAVRIENNYDVVAQVLGEMCDGGLVGGTEANALRDVVDTPSWTSKLLGGVGLPGSSPALNPATGALGLKQPGLKPTLSTSGSQIPWRRSNVRHTSNELYVDIVETLSVTFAPSGRPLAAFAHGSIAFTSKVSGVPDLLLTLTTSSGAGMGDRTTKLHRTMDRPVFHPCVRLARWKDRGELSFVPPDGRFLLAGYEVDLLDGSSDAPLSAKTSQLNLPASIEVRTGLGTTANEFEVRLTINNRISTSSGGAGSISGGNASASLSSHLSRPSSARSTSADSKSPQLEDLSVSIPIPTAVRNITDLRPSKGEAHWSPGDAAVEWKISGKEAASIGNAGAILRVTVVGPLNKDEDVGMGMGAGANGAKSETYDYDEGDAYQADSGDSTRAPSALASAAERDGRKAAQTASALMPTSANLSFGLKGWLASGIRVDSLNVDVRKSKGVGESVKPYKGVKYLTISRAGVEVRC